MINNLKYSFKVLKSGGIPVFLNVSILYIAFLLLGTFSIYGLNEELPAFNFNFLHIGIVGYLLLYFDNSMLRFTSPLELTHILVFPTSSSQKFLKLSFIEMMSIKFLLILVYVIVQIIFNQLYTQPVIILCIILFFISYHLIYLPFLLMVKRKVAFLYIFRAIYPLVFLGPLLFLKAKKHISDVMLKKIASFFNYQPLLVIIIFALILVLNYLIGLQWFKYIYRKYPFQDDELVEKLKTRKR